MKDKKLRNTLIIILFAVALVFVVVKFSDITSFLGIILAVANPIIIGFVLAYVLNLPYNFFKNKAFAKIGSKHKKLEPIKKPLSLLVTYLIVLGFVVLFVLVIIPKIIESVSSMLGDVPKYAKKISEVVITAVQWIDNTFGLSLSESENIQQLIENITGTKITTIITTIIGWVFPKALSTAITTATGFYNGILGLIFSIYMLISKEYLLGGFSKLSKAIFSTKADAYARKVVRVTDQKCGKFIVGKCIELLLMGVLYFAVFGICGFHFSALLATVMTITGLIPFFGVFIGAIPCAILLLLENPIECLWFLLAILILQQIDGNLIGPKVLGGSVGISGIWILVSVVVFGGLFGVMGMLFGVPIFAVIYTLIKDAVENRLKKKALKEEEMKKTREEESLKT